MLRRDGYVNVGLRTGKVMNEAEALTAKPNAGVEPNLAGIVRELSPTCRRSRRGASRLMRALTSGA